MSTAPSSSPQPPGGGPPATPPKSGGGGKVFLWIVGGCLGIVVIGVAIFVGLGIYAAHKLKEAAANPVLTATKFMVAANPDLETVSSDDNSIVVHDRKTGQNMTIKIDPDKKTAVMTDGQGKTVTWKLDANNKLVVTDEKGKTATFSADQNTGSVEIKSSEGSFKAGGAADKPPDWIPSYPGSTATGTYSAANDQGQTGAYAYVTSDSVDKVLSFYGDALKSAGLKVSTTTVNTNGKAGGIVSGSSEPDVRSAMITVSAETDGTHVGVTYHEKKQPN